MKRPFFLLLALSLVLPLQAQRVKDKPFDLTLREYTPAEIEQLFGKPEELDPLEWDGSLMKYPHVSFYFEESWDPHHPEEEPVLIWEGFLTDSPDFCILSQDFKGGIKVGDSLEKILKLDFAHTSRGKGREKNGPRIVVDHGTSAQYVIFGEEYERIFLNFENGILKEIFSDGPQDWERIEGGLLFRISGGDLSAPSYVLATFPNAPAGFANQVAGLDKVWPSVRKVYREDPERGSWSRTVPDEMYLPEGQKLEDIYSWKDYSDIVDYVRKVTGFRPEELEWTPEGLRRHLIAILMEKALPELSGTKDDMASALCQRALAEGKEVQLLPPAYRDYWKNAKEEPGLIRYGGGSLLQMVQSPEGDPDHLKDRIRRLYEAYLAEDTDEIGYTLAEGEEYSSPLFLNAICENRSQWIPELTKAMQEGPVLVLVDFSAYSGYSAFLSEFIMAGYDIRSVSNL